MSGYSKTKKIRDKRYLRWLSMQPPLVIGTGDTVPHHLKCSGYGGIGTKPGDNYCIPLPHSVHNDVHNKGELSTLELYGYCKDDLLSAAENYYKKYINKY